MDIKPTERSIRELLGAQKQYVIPRFQREYSWDKRNYNEFLLDMLGNLKVEKDQIIPTNYFMGTMLFVGDADDKAQGQSQVVDGQQRLTTITILFSALSNVFSEIGENKLAENVFRYIMAEDDNGHEVRVLKTVTSYPYFSYFIQKRDKVDAGQPESEEEKSIEETYSFFYKQLQESLLRASLKKLGKDHGLVPYVEILKALRDQVLTATIIEIYTSDNSVANKLFEILNAKGKQLSYIDLVKNKIFEHENEIEPADFASETWSEISKLINSGKERTGFATFFRQYWSSKYKSSTASTLYKDFETIVKVEDYKDLLRDLKKEATVYQHISNPSREAFENKKQYFFLVQILSVFNAYFSVIQVRVPLLALFYAKERGLIKLGKLEKVAKYLEGFHFVYNSVMSKSPNRIEPIYSKFSVALRKCGNPNDAENVIQDKLITQLDQLFPKFDEFRDEFVKITYTKQDNPQNLKAKYVLNKLYGYYQSENLFDEKGSVEHIIPEDGGMTTNIGNLILLERDLNNLAGDVVYVDKVEFYRKSKYKWVEKFVAEHHDWGIGEVEDRAKFLAKEFYEKVLKRG
jgi:Uncharacterized conserved protein